MSPGLAIGTAVVLAVGALGGGLPAAPGVRARGGRATSRCWCSYSGPLKHVVIIDVLTIAIGFVLRAVAGAVAIDVPISHWLLILTMLGALFLALSKRRHELVLLADGATGHRPILEEYSPYLLDQMIAVVTASALVSYVIYTVSPETVAKFHTHYLGLTLVFPIYGIFRYLYLVHLKEGGGSPADTLLNDRPLLACVALWAMTVTLHHLLGLVRGMAKSKVALLKTSPATVLRDYHSVMNLAGYQEVVKKDADTALKVNISWHFFFPAASTTPWQLDGVIKAMKQDGYKPDLIHACHNRTVVIDAHLGERENKQINVVEAHKLRNIHIYETEEWVNIRDAVGDLTKKFTCLNEVYPKGFMIPKRFIGENIIHLPTVKTHVFTTTTGAMKNAFGGLLNEHRHWTHPVIHETLVDLLMIQKKIHRGVFAVMDGTFAGDGPGPRCMMPYAKNVLLASADQVAIDAVAAKLMGFNPMDIKFIRMAHEMGLGCGDPRDIEIVGDTEAGKRELALRRPVQEDDLRLPHAAQDLLGTDEEADRVVPENGPRAVGVHRERDLPRQFLVSGQREAHDARRAQKPLGQAVPQLGEPDA